MRVGAMSELGVRLAERAAYLRRCVTIERSANDGPCTTVSVGTHLLESTSQLLDAAVMELWVAKRAIESAAAEALEQRLIGHGEGQEHTIADVNAGRVDDLIAPRLARERRQP